MSSWGKFNAAEPPKKHWSNEEAIEKLSTFCAYQERCQWEVRRKLYEKGIKGQAAEELLAEMIQAEFINEERYSRAFARGKFRLKKWGRNRIQRELKMKEISPRCIQYGLSEIDPVEYYDVLFDYASKKWGQIIEKDGYKKQYKLTLFLMSKGFESDLIKDVIEEIRNDSKSI